MFSWALGCRAACRSHSPSLHTTFCCPRQASTAIKQRPLCRSPSGRVLGQSRFRTGKARPHCGHRRLGNEGLGSAGDVPHHARPQGAGPAIRFLVGSSSIFRPDGQGLVPTGARAVSDSNAPGRNWCQMNVSRPKPPSMRLYIHAAACLIHTGLPTAHTHAAKTTNANRTESSSLQRGHWSSPRTQQNAMRPVGTHPPCQCQ